MNLRVAFYPNTPGWLINPYLSLLKQALEQDSVVVVNVNNDFLSTRWLLDNRSRVDVLHFHWIQYHYLGDSGVGSKRAFINFFRKLIFARLLGFRVVWTLHNLLPHEQLDGNLDLSARRAMVRLSDAIIVLCEQGRRELAQEFGRTENVYVSPIGKYEELHLEKMPCSEARRRLSFSDRDFIYLFFGAVRHYKGVLELARTFSSLDGEHLKLVIVGAVHDEDVRSQLRLEAEKDPRILVQFSLVPDDELQLFLTAADIVVLPFTKILSSSSVIAALSYGKPVIVPELGCIPEWVNLDCGILYGPADIDGLRHAMLMAQEADLQRMSSAAFDRADGFSWDTAAVETIAAYHGK